ncbi:MAG: DUF2071 domain-containing protein [Chitinophagaceae bacterium]
MNIPTIQGLIDRRILINFTADAATVQQMLPAPFSPKLYEGKAIVGICLIRLKQIRPKGFPSFIGISSENAAHRIAVEWQEKDGPRQGVFIPRRDTSSLLNSAAGGRIFPGKHFHAKFNVKESAGKYKLAITGNDGTSISIAAEQTSGFPQASIFKNLRNASAFFEAGATGYSPGKKMFEGLTLKTFDWKVTPLLVESVRSSFFENEALFPKGSVQFDNALLMTGIEHEWHAVPEKNLCV